MGKKKNGKCVSGDPRKRAIKTPGFDKIVDRNGCTLIIPSDGNSEEGMNFLERVKNSFEFYAVDGVVYPEGDIIDITTVPILENMEMSHIKVKDHNDPNSMEKMIMLPSKTLENIKAFFLKFNFSSWEAFKTNLLPNYNGPDNACFVGVDFMGGKIGAKFSIPKDCVTAF